MRIPVRISRLARWSRRLASVALPLMVISIFLHRARYLESETFTLIVAATSGLAALALAMAIAAFVRLWYSGHRGWSRAIQGLLLSSVLLVPAGYAIVFGAQSPPINDVSTAPVESLPLAIAANPRHALLEGQALADHFPNARTRTYPLAVPPVYELVERLVAERGWELIRRSPPDAGANFGELHAIASTWFGWRDEIVVLVDGRSGTTAVAMRSASLFGASDLGTNGRRVEAFLRDLDNSVGAAINAELAARSSEEPALPQPPPRQN